MTETAPPGDRRRQGHHQDGHRGPRHHRRRQRHHPGRRRDRRGPRPSAVKRATDGTRPAVEAVAATSPVTRAVGETTQIVADTTGPIAQSGLGHDRSCRPDRSPRDAHGVRHRHRRATDTVRPVTETTLTVTDAVPPTSRVERAGFRGSSAALGGPRLRPRRRAARRRAQHGTAPVPGARDRGHSAERAAGSRRGPDSAPWTRSQPSRGRPRRTRPRPGALVDPCASQSSPGAGAGLVPDRRGTSPLARCRDPTPRHPRRASSRARTHPPPWHRPAAPRRRRPAAPLHRRIQPAVDTVDDRADDVRPRRCSPAPSWQSSPAGALQRGGHRRLHRRRVRGLPDRPAPPHAAPAADPLHLAERAPRLRTSSPAAEQKLDFRR